MRAAEIEARDALRLTRSLGLRLQKRRSDNDPLTLGTNRLMSFLELQSDGRSTRWIEASHTRVADSPSDPCEPPRPLVAASSTAGVERTRQDKTSLTFSASPISSTLARTRTLGPRSIPVQKPPAAGRRPQVQRDGFVPVTAGPVIKPAGLSLRIVKLAVGRLTRGPPFGSAPRDGPLSSTIVAADPGRP